jgi:DNA polymerase-3 subunit delta
LAKTITKRFLGAEESQDSVVILTPESIKADAEIIITELSSKSFFCTKKLVIIEDVADSSLEVIQKAEEILAADKEVFLVLCAGELKKESKIRKYFEGSKSLTALLCYKEDAANLKRQLGTWLRSDAISADNDTLDYLAANLGEDKLITQNEMEKILIYLGDSKKLSFEEATHIVADNSDMALNDIAFAVSCKNVKLLDKSLARAIADNTAPIAILRAVLWHFNRLLNAKLMIRNGMQQDMVIDSLRLFFKHKDMFKQSLRLWSEERLIRAVKALTKLELDVKTNYGDDEMLMRDKLLKMAV